MADPPWKLKKVPQRQPPPRTPIAARVDPSTSSAAKSISCPPQPFPPPCSATREADALLLAAASCPPDPCTVKLKKVQQQQPPPRKPFAARVQPFTSSPAASISCPPQPFILASPRQPFSLACPPQPSSPTCSATEDDPLLPAPQSCPPDQPSSPSSAVTPPPSASPEHEPENEPRQLSAKAQRVLSILAGQLKWNRYDRMLNTLMEEFEGFHSAVIIFAADMSLKESSNFARSFKQKLPANITEEDLLNFNVRQEYDLLRAQCPLLFHVVTGAMGLTEGELEEPSHCLSGGTQSKVSLVEPITQVIGQVHKLGHPRSRSLLSIVNGCFGAIKHLDGELHKLGSTTGTMISKKSSLQILDRCASGMNKKVLALAKAIRDMWLQHPHSLARRKTLALLNPGFTIIIDNLGWFISPRHMDRLEKKGAFQSDTQVLALMNRVPTSHLSDEPVAGCSPPELLKSGKLFPSEEDLSLLLPYLEYVVQDCLVTHVPELKQFKKDVRPPKHKYSLRMSEPSVWEPLGVHDFNSAVNHDLIALSSLINKYAPDRPDGGKMKVATHADQACAERLLHCGWTMSEEGTMAALVPVSSAFHRDMCDLKMIMAKYFHNSELGITGTLANIKKRFHHNHAGKDAKDYYATYDLVEVTWRMHLVKLALSLIDSRGLPKTSSEFEALAKDLVLEFNRFDKYKRGSLSDCPNLSLSDTVELLEASEAPLILDIPITCNKKVKEGTQVCDDLMLEEVEDMAEQSNQMEGVEVKDLLTYEEYHKDFLHDASLLLMAKQIERRGDGRADNALWRLLLPDFFINGHVKYGIESLRRTCISEGAMGIKMAKDVTYNCYVNTKGHAHSNLPADLHMEHCNKEAKSDISSARGNISAKVVTRAGRLGPLKKALEEQLFPVYTDSGEGTNTKGYEGHGDAKWQDQVAEGVREMKDSGPGSLRRPPQLTGKDWTPENSREIPWVPLEKFMQRHAKSTDCYIRETFHMDMKGYCQDGVGDVPLDPYEQDGLGEEGSGVDNHLDFDSLSILK